MCCYNGCMSAWFCEREVRVVDCRWYKSELCGIFFPYKQLVDLFSISAHVIVFLKNIYSTIYDEVKLIWTSSSIIIILVPNKESQTHLELHKALTTRTNFQINLEVYKLFFSLKQFLIMCLYNLFKLFIFFYIYANAFIIISVVFV
jgi:hypothetical protein